MPKRVFDRSTSYESRVIDMHTGKPVPAETKPMICDRIRHYREELGMEQKALAAVVGATRPKAVFYGNNRADFSFIPGNVAPGLLFRHPDHFENYDDWPFLWGQNEGTIAGNTEFLIFGSSFKNLLAVE